MTHKTRTWEITQPSLRQIFLHRGDLPLPQLVLYTRAWGPTHTSHQINTCYPPSRRASGMKVIRETGRDGGKENWDWHRVTQMKFEMSGVDTCSVRGKGCHLSCVSHILLYSMSPFIVLPSDSLYLKINRYQLFWCTGRYILGRWATFSLDTHTTVNLS